MARIALRTAKDRSAREVLFDRAQDPIHLAVCRLSPGETGTLAGGGGEGAAYVWQGSLRFGATDLPAGSSLILEAGAQPAVSAGTDGATVVLFHANQPAKAGQAKVGQVPGAVHLLPDSQVPRYAPEPGAGGAAGGLHANGECPTCQVWLHENQLPGMAGGDTAAVAERGIHSHSEDEIIFITAGTMRLGARLVGPGTAIAIARDTFYSFTPGPEGLSFINFRPARPSAFRMKQGGSFDEPGYWQERVSPPVYLA